MCCVRGVRRRWRAVDGKPLTIGPNSRDPHARWGYGAGTRANGYKLHMLLSMSGVVLAWRVASMNVGEREMARRLMRQPGQAAMPRPARKHILGHRTRTDESTKCHRATLRLSRKRLGTPDPPAPLGPYLASRPGVGASQTHPRRTAAANPRSTARKMNNPLKPPATFVRPDGRIRTHEMMRAACILAPRLP